MTVPLYRLPPVTVDGRVTQQDIRQFTEMDYELIKYNAALAFARHLSDGQPGSLNNTGTGTQLGSTRDNRRTQRTNTSRGNNSRGVQTSDFPGFPGTGEADTVYNFYQNRAGTNTSINPANSYAYWNGTDLQNQSDTNIINNLIVNDVMDNYINGGQEIGQYRIATSSPGVGWSDQGVWFRDTRYNNSTINTYRLYLKTNGVTPAGHTPLVGTASGLQESIGRDSPFIQTVILPLILARYPLYEVLSNGNGNRGVWVDTELTGTSNTRTESPRDFYRSISTPSGSAATRNTNSLEIITR